MIEPFDSVIRQKLSEKVQGGRLSVERQYIDFGCYFCSLIRQKSAAEVVHSSALQTKINGRTSQPSVVWKTKRGNSPAQRSATTWACRWILILLWYMAHWQLGFLKSRKATASYWPLVITSLSSIFFSFHLLHKVLEGILIDPLTRTARTKMNELYEISNSTRDCICFLKTP